MPDFPVMSRDLVELAEENDFPEEVIEFYSRFLRDEPFFKAEDLHTRTEQVLILEHQDAPAENMVANEED